jgi:hypothetical protein
VCHTDQQVFLDKFLDDFTCWCIQRTLSSAEPYEFLVKLRNITDRIDTRPEGTLLCVLAEGKRPNFFYVLWRHPGVHTALCTYVFLWKTSVCTAGWRHMMAYFHVSTRKISDKISSEWHFWSSIYSVPKHLEIWKSWNFTNITRTWSIQIRECYWLQVTFCVVIGCTEQSFVWRT